MGKMHQTYTYILKTLLFSESAESTSLATKYGYDNWVMTRFLEYVPDIHAFLFKMETPPTQYIRVNTLKITKSELEDRLKSKGFKFRDTVIPEVLAVQKAPIAVGATTEYLLGHYYIQDLSSCMAVEALDVRESETILDMAAAPGGKTAFISQKMNNSGLVVALEISQKRARSMSFNLARCGVSNTCIIKMDSIDVEKLKMKFDRILLDAPCSCGVIAKDITRKKAIHHKT